MLKRLLLGALFVVGCKPAPQADVVYVAAAADLRDAFGELATVFEQQHATKVVTTFGSSGLLAKQIQQGAPFDVYAAANRKFVDDVVKSHSCDASTIAEYGRGRLVLWSVDPVTGVDDPSIQKLAIANPEHAPYGQAAKEALTTLGHWDALQTRLVYGENVRQTLQFAETGNVDAAIVALSLVVHHKTQTWTIIDERTHRPLDQTLIVCNGGTNRAGGTRFASFVNSPKGREVMRRYGFLLPNEQTIQSP